MMHADQVGSALSHTRQAVVKPATVRFAAMFSADVLAILLASGLAFMIHMAVDLPPVDRAFRQVMAQGLNWHGWGTVLVLTILLTYFGSRGHYTSRVPIWTELRTLFLGTILAMLCDSFIRVAVYGLMMGFETVARWLVLVPCVLVSRHLARAFLNAIGVWRLRTLIIGTADAVGPVRAAFISEPQLGYEVVGCVDLDSSSNVQAPGWGTRLLKQCQAEFAVVAIAEDAAGAGARVAEDLSRERLPFALVPAFAGLPVTDVSSHYFFSYDVMLLVYGNNLAQPVSRMLKTVFDQAIAIVMLLLLSPLLIVLTLLVKLDGGPALYGHRRVGESGRHFRCLKFRSMVVNGDDMLAELLARDPLARAEWEATQKLRHDPRVTRLGRVLRKTSLDELPQLLNVLRREMSLVGPRPIVDAEVARYGRDISFYYETRPGITGLWQVSGRSNTSYEYRVRLDVWYVRNWSLWHDIAILLKTIPAVLAKEGAV